MRYYKMIDDGKVIAVGTGAGGTEISKDEYESLLYQAKEIAFFDDKICAGEIAIGDVPERLREQVQQTLDQRLQLDDLEEDEEISSDEALRIILGGEVR